jgi:hypothetical protein
MAAAVEEGGGDVSSDGGLLPSGGYTGLALRSSKRGQVGNRTKTDIHLKSNWSSSFVAAAVESVTKARRRLERQ